MSIMSKLKFKVTLISKKEEKLQIQKMLDCDPHFKVK